MPRATKRTAVEFERDSRKVWAAAWLGRRRKNPAGVGEELRNAECGLKNSIALVNPHSAFRNSDGSFVNLALEAVYVAAHLLESRVVVCGDGVVALFLE